MGPHANDSQKLAGFYGDHNDGISSIEFSSSTLPHTCQFLVVTAVLSSAHSLKTDLIKENPSNNHQLAMSAEFKDEVTSFLIEKLRDTEVFKFIQSLIRESVERIIRPDIGMNVKELSDQKLICHSIIYHYLINAGYRAAAEVMQAECYECFLSHDFLMNNVEPFDDNSVETSLGQHKLKDGITITRVSRRKSGNGIVSDMKLPTKPDPQYEQTKEKIREEIITSADKAVERKHELMKANEMLNEELTDEEEEDEESKERESETKFSTSSESTTVESETPDSNPRLLYPEASVLPTGALRPLPDLSHSQVDELSDIETIAGIDQLLESARSDSISF
ncbi:unnamed protein product [Angiostrongylus costaricensis]|uniref:LisH domain-containing protein n=1 Tax=Angiostrongylus costaricensis TaxID=334426 RepID=A0A0R3PJ62_ANGCS|nr:unnamed protein product [Angiostrongylus costaricensis]